MKEDIFSYIQGFLSYDNPVLEELEAETRRRQDTQPTIGIQTGTFLSWLIQVIQAQRVLEFGACLGYSTIFLAEALRKTGGRLTAIECDVPLFEETRRNVEKAGLSDVVQLIHGDAGEIIEQLDGPFDLILQDADKGLYPMMLEKCIQKTRQFGVIAADDALFVPMGVHERHSRPIHEYNQMVFADERLISTILPIGDGLTISMKR